METPRRPEHGYPYSNVTVNILIAIETADRVAACQNAVVLMGRNAERWMERLDIQGNALNSFMEFEN